MELKSIEIEQFKNVESVALELSTINILVGTNGSGKSSILQACHLAATVLRQTKKISGAVIAFTELEYMPTSDAKALGHFTQWGNRADQPGTVVRFGFSDDTGTAASAECTIRMARNNSGLSMNGAAESTLANQFRSRGKFFTAYIPGLSGIPNEEKKLSKRVVLTGASFGDSNAYLRNVLLLLKQDDPNFERLNGYISELFGDISVSVDFDEVTDFTISASAVRRTHRVPLEQVGTGILQSIQIFSYLLLFKPKLLLIDEPDVHLHPSVQEQFLGVLQRAAVDVGAKVIVSTHSPYIVRGASPETRIYWVKDGKVSGSDQHQTEVALGWGAMGKKVLLTTEDANIGNLRHLLSQWPELERQVAIVPGRGYGKLPSPEEAKELRDALNGALTVVVHRDRDALTDAEVAEFVRRYEAEDGVTAFVTGGADIENYFLDEIAFQTVLANEEFDLDGAIETILQRQNEDIGKQFDKRRKAANAEFYPTGGSPTNEAVKQEYEAGGLRIASGKLLFTQVCQSNGLGNRKQEIISAACSIGIADDVREFLAAVVAS